MVTTAPSSKRASRSGPSGFVSVREQRAEAIRFRRALTLVGLSVIAPGSAQVDGRQPASRQRAVAFWVGMVVVCGLVLWLVPFDQLARLAVRPWLLNAFTLLAFGMALGWSGISSTLGGSGIRPG